jgi:hypothetical protein
MKLRLYVAFLFAASPAFGETLLTGAIYFDSQSTFREVQDLIKANDMDGLARLIQGRHISEKIRGDLEVILLFSDSTSVEFRFANNPTTYWTYPKYISVNTPQPAASPSPSATLSSSSSNLFPPGDLHSSLASDAASPRPTPKPTPPPATPPPVPSPSPPAAVPPAVPSPTPKVGQEQQEAPEAQEEPQEQRRTSRSNRHKHPRTKGEKGVPDEYKVWHLVNGHWKWYDKRNLHEVRKTLPATAETANVPPPPPTVLPTAPPASSPSNNP